MGRFLEMLHGPTRWPPPSLSQRYRFWKSGQIMALTLWSICLFTNRPSIRTPKVKDQQSTLLPSGGDYAQMTGEACLLLEGLKWASGNRDVIMSHLVLLLSKFMLVKASVAFARAIFFGLPKYPICRWCDCFSFPNTVFSSKFTIRGLSCRDEWASQGNWHNGAWAVMQVQDTALMGHLEGVEPSPTVIALFLVVLICVTEIIKPVIQTAEGFSLRERASNPDICRGCCYILEGVRWTGSGMW